MAAEEAYVEFEGGEDPYDDTWYSKQIWKPPGDIELQKPIIVREMKRRKIEDLPAVSPSMFTNFAFRMPRENEEGRIVIDNFSFEGRRHLERIYDTPAKKLLLICGRQVEKSTLLGNIALCYMSLVQGYRVLYVSPSATQTKTFSNDRVKEPIETSPVLKKFTTHMLSQNIFEKQFINRSKITMRYAFLNADRARGIPSYMLECDELQDILGDNLPVLEECLSHAPERWKRQVYSGTPKSLDNTIEQYRIKRSTQSEWVVPHDCKSGEGGRYWNILGEKNIGLKGLICERCGTLINPMCDGAQWAHMVMPTDRVDFESYRISQLMVPWVPWTDILTKYRNYGRDRFYNEVLGISYDSGMRPLTTQQVKDCCKDHIKMSEVEQYRHLSYTQPVFAGIDWGCHDEGTRILTKGRGFQYFRDLRGDDEVAQWDPDTREMTFVIPKVRTVRDWDQPLLHFETKSGMDLMVTHTHRMRVGVRQGKSWLTESAGELAQRGDNVNFVGYVEWAGHEVEHFTLPGLSKSPGYAGSKDITYDMDGWLEFLGYMLTEGGVCLKRNKAGELTPYCLKMSQRDSVSPDRYQKMQECLTRVGIPHSALPNPKTGAVNWTICGKQYWQWFAQEMGMTGDVKRIPRQFLLLSKRQLRILFDGLLLLGDGYVDPRDNCMGGAYYSTSKGLCEDFQELCIKLGLRCTVQAIAGGNRKTRWRALWSAGRDQAFNTPSGRVKRVPYNGRVYCCSVPTGYIVTERNGCVAYQGNTGEHSYTVVFLGMYIGMTFRIFFAHRFTGEETEPDLQMQRLIELLKYFNVRLIGADYGGGFAMNHKLIHAFGAERVHQFQYLARTSGKKVQWNGKLGRWQVARTEVMSDIFNAIKRQKCEFPRWEEFEDPHANDMLNIYSEYNQKLRMIQYDHAQDNPDDSFHSLLYCWVVSMFMVPRPDITAPTREDPRTGYPVMPDINPIDQS